MPERPPRAKRPATSTQHKTWDHGGKNAKERGYDRHWRRLRNAFIAAHPTCADPFGMHGGRVVPADEVDHIIPLSQGGNMLDWDGLQSLCRQCHILKTRRERM